MFDQVIARSVGKVPTLQCFSDVLIMEKEWSRRNYSPWSPFLKFQAVSINLLIDFMRKKEKFKNGMVSSYQKILFKHAVTINPKLGRQLIFNEGWLFFKRLSNFCRESIQDHILAGHKKWKFNRERDHKLLFIFCVLAVTVSLFFVVFYFMIFLVFFLFLVVYGNARTWICLSI